MARHHENTVSALTLMVIFAIIICVIAVILIPDTKPVIISGRVTNTGGNHYGYRGPDSLPIMFEHDTGKQQILLFCTGDSLNQILDGKPVTITYQPESGCDRIIAVTKR